MKTIKKSSPKIKLTPEQKEANKVARQQAKKLEKELARIEAEKNQKPVSEILFNIEWKKSAMWGHNPNMDVVVRFIDGTSVRGEGYKCSGCGYDKESTVIAEAFNTFLKYLLHKPALLRKKNPPYGFYISKERKLYNGGVGTQCYYEIAKFIGGKFERVSSGKSFDVYKFTNIKNL